MFVYNYTSFASTLSFVIIAESRSQASQLLTTACEAADLKVKNFSLNWHYPTTQPAAFGPFTNPDDSDYDDERDNVEEMENADSADAEETPYYSGVIATEDGIPGVS